MVCHLSRIRALLICTAATFAVFTRLGQGQDTQQRVAEQYLERLSQELAAALAPLSGPGELVDTFDRFMQQEKLPKGVAPRRLFDLAVGRTEEAMAVAMRHPAYERSKRQPAYCASCATRIIYAKLPEDDRPHWLAQAIGRSRSAYMIRDLFMLFEEDVNLGALLIAAETAGGMLSDVRECAEPSTLRGRYPLRVCDVAYNFFTSRLSVPIGKRRGIGQHLGYEARDARILRLKQWLREHPDELERLCGEEADRRSELRNGQPE